MAESNPLKKKIPTDYISDSESSEEETNQHLHTSQEERLYHIVKDLHKPRKQHLHILQHSVTPQLKEDQPNNQR